MTDVTQTLEFEASRRRQVGLVVLGLALTALSAVAAWQLYPNIAPGSFIEFAGWVIIVFLIVFTGIFLWRLMASKKLRLVLSPHGFHYSTISAAPIPWTAVEGFSSWRFGGGSGGMKLPGFTANYIQSEALVVKLSDAAWLSIYRPKLRETMKMLGADGLIVSSPELPIAFDELRLLFEEYKAAYG
jgi:hypothetical protein